MLNGGNVHSFTSSVTMNSSSSTDLTFGGTSSVQKYLFDSHAEFIASRGRNRKMNSSVSPSAIVKSLLASPINSSGVLIPV